MPIAFKTTSAIRIVRVSNLAIFITSLVRMRKEPRLLDIPEMTTAR
jgi:hypothetical protein